MTMFTGDNSINMDAKGRFVMPSKYRERLEQLCANQLVVTIDTQVRCLLVYPRNEWEKIAEKIEALPSFQPGTIRIKRLILGHAQELEIDSNGRILLPASLREYAFLEKKLVLLGQGKKFELWDEAEWTKVRDGYLEVEAQEGEMPQELMNIAL
ncbi:division/cell wall cluster transcriptional repressor MraZ [Allohahella marinimesophila]|uniref:Transcriptional regulator MraZ n=2 Tax=Allohahella marinimesophila TaxID=1054972 RepID=A0ABP7NG92_9GAMM